MVNKETMSVYAHCFVAAIIAIGKFRPGSWSNNAFFVEDLQSFTNGKGVELGIKHPEKSRLDDF